MMGVQVVNFDPFQGGGVGEGSVGAAEPGRVLDDGVTEDVRSPSAPARPQPELYAQDKPSRSEGGGRVFPTPSEEERFPSAAKKSAGKSGKGGKANKPEIPASARDELMRVLFAEGGTGMSMEAPGFQGAARQAGDELRQKAREGRKPFYEDAYRSGADGFESPEFERMAASPLFARAMQRAESTLNDRAMLPDTVSTGMQGAQGRTLEYWDQVGQRLDDMLVSAKRAGADDRVAEIEEMRRSLRDKLDGAFPKYKAARGPGEQFFGATDAFEAGMKFARGRYPLTGAGQAIAAMGGDEKKLFAEGFAQAFVEDVRSAPDRLAKLDRMNAGEAGRNKIRLALGAKADQLEAFLRLEASFQGSGEGDPVAKMADVIMRGSQMTEQPINRHIAQHVAVMLTSKNPDIFLDGLKAAAKPEVLEGLRAMGMGGVEPKAADPNAAAFGKARDAIARGADRTAVMKRLQDNGISPKGLM